MSIDRYTKTVLTVIALCLIWLSLGGPSLLPVVGAQQGATEVVIVGWRDGNGETWKLPAVGVPTRPTGAFPDERAQEVFRATQLRGARMPVVTQ